MSQEDVQRVREGLLASASGDPLAGLGFWDPSIEWDMSGVIGWPEKQVYRGPEVTEFLRAWADSWQGWHFDVEEVCDGGGEAVFAGIHEWATGAESGASVDQRRYFVFTMREGRGGARADVQRARRRPRSGRPAGVGESRGCRTPRASRPRRAWPARTEPRRGISSSG